MAAENDRPWPVERLPSGTEVVSAHVVMDREAAWLDALKRRDRALASEVERREQAEADLRAVNAQLGRERDAALARAEKAEEALERWNRIADEWDKIGKVLWDGDMLPAEASLLERAKVWVARAREAEAELDAARLAVVREEKARVDCQEWSVRAERERDEARRSLAVTVEALREIEKEVGTSTLAWKLARSALARIEEGT